MAQDKNKSLFKAELLANILPAKPKGLDIDQMFADAGEKQTLICKHLGVTVFLAANIGRTLNVIAAMVPHGECEDLIAEEFCKPYSVSTRTAQRYRAIASKFDVLLDALRKEHPDKSLTDQELLGMISINQALRLIRSIHHSADAKKLFPRPPSVDPNEWLTPPQIAELVVSFLKVVDLDPCGQQGFNAVDALQVVCKPMDGLKKDTPWKGRLYINPGVKGTKFFPWVERTLFEIEQGNVEEAILVLPACMNANYAVALREYPRAFTVRPLKETGPSGQQLIKLPLMVVYVGPQGRFGEFAATFNVPDTCVVFVPANCRS